VGWELAQDGAALCEVLDGLRAVYRRLVGTEPSYDDVVAICTAWSESTLGFLHQISCEDPMTGLASLAHVRTRLSEVYRGESRFRGDVAQHFALVIADTPGDAPWLRNSGDELPRALRMTQLAEGARTVFSGHETIGRLTDHRIVVVVDRDDRLGRRVALLNTLLAQSMNCDTRVWIEGLPPSDHAAGHLLDELARP
jgi:hypothetical protein